MFPHEIQQPSYEDRADLLRAEFDYRSPKLRISVFAYLVENGIEPDLEKIDEIVSYISDEIVEYADDVATLGPELTIIPGDDETDGDPYDLNGGYR
jgi:hypothetical protein